MLGRFIIERNVMKYGKFWNKKNFGKS